MTPRRRTVESPNENIKVTTMAKYLVAWFLGVPFSLLLLFYLLFH
ncbi:phosphate/sulfate permease [Silvimonas terrae]|uniref:Phosphate/sulfate permease n=1 Tax=Silvimonas terrae TaxID=300266 RepID=A0A840RB70_9NEIS|nr:phosphate/sulfate permease [Silvimonas terrae]